MSSAWIERIAMDPARGDGGVLCQLSDGRVFVTLVAEIGKFAQAADADALPAFNRAWERAPDLFAGPLRPRQGAAFSANPFGASLGAIATAQSQRIGEVAGPVTTEHGFIGELTARDRARLEAIIRKNHRKFFADQPTRAQVDNLIDGIGLRTAEKLVKAQVDSGRIQ